MSSSRSSKSLPYSLLPESETPNYEDSCGKLDSDQKGRKCVVFRRSFVFALTATCLVSLLINVWIIRSYTLQVSAFSPLPYLPLTTSVFAATERYTQEKSEASDLAWAELRLDPSGYVLLDEATRDKYQLQPGIPHVSGSQIYGTSMYHHLHCLTMLRSVYWDLIYTIEEPETSVNRTFPRDSHIAHCFDYLRQGIQCAADLTIEPADLSELGHSKINGWGVEHRTCKDWRVADQWLRVNGVPERQ